MSMNVVCKVKFYLLDMQESARHTGSLFFVSTTHQLPGGVLQDLGL